MLGLMCLSLTRRTSKILHWYSLNGLKVLETDLNQQNFIPRKKGGEGERRKKRRKINKDKETNAVHSLT